MTPPAGGDMSSQVKKIDTSVLEMAVRIKVPCFPYI